MLVLLLACAPANKGNFDLIVSSEETDCDEPPASFFGRVYIDVWAEQRRVLPFDDLCGKEEDAFQCELAAFDKEGNLGAAGIKAVVTIDIDLSGNFDEQGLAGTASWATTCEGHDCEAAAPVSPEFCVTTWNWVGVSR